jgi:hypothetical protein
VRRISRIGIGLAALGCATGAAGQNFQQSLSRYRTAKATCTEAFQVRIARGCNADCRTKAAAREVKCLAGAEERYRAALRRELQPRR